MRLLFDLIVMVGNLMNILALDYLAASQSCGLSIYKVIASHLRDSTKDDRFSETFSLCFDNAVPDAPIA